LKTNDIASALLSKIELLFSDIDSFVAFTIPGIALTSKDLAFHLTDSTSGLTPQQALEAASSFARLVNLTPDVSRQWSSDGRVIWSMYEIVLNQAVLASDNTTAAEGEELQKAKEYLYEQKEVSDLLGQRNTIVDTDNLSKYKLYRASYLQSQYEYNAMKLRADLSSDPTVKSEWIAIEPLRKSSVDQAFQDWVSKGFKGDVEKAFATIEQITGRSPRITWEKWKNEFEQNRMTDLAGQDFYQTYFYPHNFYESVSPIPWMTINLDTSEIENLNSATGTTSIFPLGTGEDFTILSLSIELIRVSIVRPWLESNLFRSRFWQWADGRSPLSDGATPPAGDLPAYTSEAIFARNLFITFHPTLTENTKIISTLRGGGSLGLGSFSFKDADLSATNDLLKSDNSQVIGFICQKILKSPNPDLTLDWSGPNFAFPMQGEREDQIATGISTGNMKTRFTVDSNGNLSANTRTWTNDLFIGFTGGVFIGITDSFETIIWKTDMTSYGVDGKLIGRSDRTEVWNAVVPPSIFKRARGYVIVHEHTPKFPIADWFETDEGKKFIRGIVQSF
jgi:hypothetical protein